MVEVLRARRKRLAWGGHENRLYSRHRWLVEGVHGLAKTLHGMARAARRGLENMKIQALLTATAINLKRLAKAILLALIRALISDQSEQTMAASQQTRMTLSTAPGGLFFRRTRIRRFRRRMRLWFTAWPSSGLRGPTGAMVRQTSADAMSSAGHRKTGCPGPACRPAA